MFSLELGPGAINSSASFSERFGNGNDEAGSDSNREGLPPPEFRSKYSVSFAEYPPSSQQQMSDPMRTRIWGPPVVRGAMSGKGASASVRFSKSTCGERIV